MCDGEYYFRSNCLYWVTLWHEINPVGCNHHIQNKHWITQEKNLTKFPLFTKCGYGGRYQLKDKVIHTNNGSGKCSNANKNCHRYTSTCPQATDEMTGEYQEVDSSLSESEITAISSISSNDCFIDDAYAIYARILRSDPREVAKFSVLLNFGVLCLRYFLCCMSSFTLSWDLTSVKFSAVYCLVWMEQFCT